MPKPWPPLPEPWFVGAMDGVGFVMLMVFISFSLVFVVNVVWWWHIERKGKTLSRQHRSFGH